MPPPPEFGDGAGDVGIVEILRVVQAQHFSHADGHVGVGGEVQIDVQRESADAHPGAQHGQVLEIAEVFCQQLCVGGGGGGQDQRVRQSAAGVCQQHLLGKARAEPGHPGGQLAGPLAEQLPVNGGVADDGAGDALVEQRGVEQHVKVAVLGRGLRPVHIHHIGQQLEGVERDADGQGDVPDGLRHRPEQAADHGGVLEVGDQGDVHDHCQRKIEGLDIGTPGLLNFQGEVPADQRHEHQQQNVFRLPPGVENQRGDQQHRVLRPPAFAQEVRQKRQREKRVQKNQTGKNHTPSPIREKFKMPIKRDSIR